MKKHNLKVRTGLLLLTLSLLATTTAAAAAGKVAYDQAGLIRFDEVVAQPGGTYTAPNGQKVPAVITYTDVTGNITNYVSIRQVAELLDVPVSWNSDSRSVVLGKVSETTPDIVTGSNQAPSSDWPETAVIGTTAGPFTEVDPSQVDTSVRAVYQLDGMEFRSKYGLARQHIDCGPGNTAVISVTNTGDHDAYFTIYRKPTVSNGEISAFTSVCIKPGKTMVRAFSLQKDADILTRDLEWSIDGGTMTAATVSVIEYMP